MYMKSAACMIGNMLIGSNVCLLIGCDIMICEYDLGCMIAYDLVNHMIRLLLILELI